MTTLLEALAKPKPITIDRSTLEVFLSCPLRCHLRETQPVEDADRKHAARVGQAFHDVMDQYISELVATGERGGVDHLSALALAGDARYQPELLHCAKLTGARFRFWRQSYIAHERQYAYTLPAYGPHGEDVILTCRPDLVTWGGSVKEIEIVDWKTGWGEDHAFQAMFYAVVLWRSIEGIERVTWRPFRCRKGTWGKPEVFGMQGGFIETSLPECESIVKAAVMDYCRRAESVLAEDDGWPADPGVERCRYCEYVRQCPADAESAIEVAPEAYLAFYLRDQQDLKNRAAELTAYAKANGPICHDGYWWGQNIISSRPTWKLNKGEPGYLGDDDEGADE